MYTSFSSYTFVKVLSHLKSHRSKYLSGQKISDALNMSRVTVWKCISKIRSLGYKVEANQKLGYKLTELTDHLLPWETKRGLETKLIGKRIYYFENIDSTQNYASKLASDPKEDGTLVIARTQSHGRGRQKREWISPKGGIWLSIILHPKFEVSKATIFPIASSLALAVAIEKVLKLKPKLKWPNDVVLNDKKVAGMLVDVSVEAGSVENLILGVGINFKINPFNLEKSLKHTENFYGVATLIKKNDAIKPVKLVQAFLCELENMCQLLADGKSRNLIRRWTKRSTTIGKRVVVSANRKKMSGKAIRINSDGALVISNKRKSHRILVGDLIS